jgi:sulfotransferase
VSTRFHFISGLPRSGSTLLAAILAQNPAFHASMTSSLGFLLNAILQTMSEAETAERLEDIQKTHILHALFEGYYAHLQPQSEVIFDTNRLWCSKLHLLRSLYPEAKLLVCVRDLPWIIDSLERLIRAAPYQYSNLFSGAQEAATLYSRVDALTQPDRLLGFAWSALKEAFYGELADRMLIIEYEYLARKPEKVMKLIYGFLGEDWYPQHDFEHVRFNAARFDRAVVGLQGLHQVRPEVRFLPRHSILPPDIQRRFQGMSFWRDTPTASRASVIALKSPTSDQGQPTHAPHNRL